MKAFWFFEEIKGSEDRICGRIFLKIRLKKDESDQTERD